MRILFLHGWQSVPGGVKPTFLVQHGHEVINPALPDNDFEEAARIAQAEFDRHQPQIVVGSSRGGAVAMNMNSDGARLVLLCPAWKKYGTAKSVEPGTVILHSKADDVIPFADSEELVNKSGLPASALIAVGKDHRLADQEPLAAMLMACEGTSSGHNCAGGDMPDTPHRFAAIVEQAILDVLLQVARYPLSHFSEKSLQVRLSAKLLENEELATPVPTDIQHRFHRNLALICEEERLTGRDLKAFLDNVYRVPPLQMEYGRGEQRRIDVAILAPEDIRCICDPVQFQVKEKGYITPIFGVEFGTEKTKWHEMPDHLSKDAAKLEDCSHGYSISVMRNTNVGRRSLKGAAAKDETVAVFKNALQDHAVRFPDIRWLGLVVNLAFGDVECFKQPADWIHCDISKDVNSLDAVLRKILTMAVGSVANAPRSASENT